ncbi:MAG: glycosyltransferase [Eubacterium sp.]|nr:glycosyltransferase [Eubacterium sp.]
MKILHYSLGFPPYRSGGLTKYCMDLIRVQKEKGHDVALMWPGKFFLSGHFVRFKKSTKKVNSVGKVESVELMNPLPVPLDEGITDFDAYTRECKNPEAFEKMLKEIKPDVIHIHTLMGLYREFLEVAKEQGIRLIFTSHDYFGICPKVTMFRNGDVCNGDCSRCRECNQGALSIKKIKLMQSSTYRFLKDSPPVKLMRKRHRSQFFREEVVEETPLEMTEEQINYREDYMELRHYYLGMLELVDEIQFNSSVTEMVYRQFIPKSVRGRVINISHENIRDCRRKKEFSNPLNIIYLAPPKPFKGYGILREALDELWEEGNENFRLHIYGNSVPKADYLTIHKQFDYSELEQIFETMDLLVAPSIWYETFGFTVLEALSFGVPVLVSNRVGCKDLLDGGYFGMVIQPTKEDLKMAIQYATEHPELLKEYNRRIVEEMDLSKVLHFSEEIEAMYGEE